MPTLAPETTTTSAPRAPIGVGTLCIIGILLGAIVTPAAIYIAVELLQVGACNMSGEERFACAMRHFAYIAISVLPGAIVGFAIAYRYCAWRERKSNI
jgi:uncharacterized membrane protein YfcA